MINLLIIWIMHIEFGDVLLCYHYFIALDLVHFLSSSTGRIITMDQLTGKLIIFFVFLWLLSRLFLLQCIVIKRLNDCFSLFVKLINLLELFVSGTFTAVNLFYVLLCWDQVSTECRFEICRWKLKKLEQHEQNNLIKIVVYTKNWPISFHLRFASYSFCNLRINKMK